MKSIGWFCSIIPTTISFSFSPSLPLSLSLSLRMRRVKNVCHSLRRSSSIQFTPTSLFSSLLLLPSLFHEQSWFMKMCKLPYPHQFQMILCNTTLFFGRIQLFFIQKSVIRKSSLLISILHFNFLILRKV